MQQCHHGPHWATRGSIATMLAGIVACMMFGPSIAATTKLRAKPFGGQHAKIKAVPMAGDLVHRVKDQLAGDHRTLGKVSAALMSVQSEVDKTEQSMLGKVLDLQTARSFFSRHEEIDTANDKLQDDISKLNTQVEGLSSELSKTQRAFLSNAHVYGKSERKLHTQVVENEALIGSMNAELAKEDEVQKELARLTQIHKELMEESVNASVTGARANELLEEARDRSSSEVSRHKSLRNQLILMNNYSIKCHGSVEKQSKKLGMAMVTASKDSEAVQLTLRQKKKATDATEQRLLAEHALLVSEVKRVETEALAEVKKLQDLRGDLDHLQENIVEEVRKLEEKIQAQKERVKTLSVDLMENEQAELSHEAKKDAMEEHLATLVKEVHESENPVLIATTEAQNDALRAELDEGFAMWKTSKTTETAALLNVDQASATHAATREALKMAHDAVDTARQEGRKKVALAVKKALVSKAKSQLTIDKAEAALAERCKTKWDAIWKKKRAKLATCKNMKEELSMERAKKETLMQTLKASIA